jgi:hypothetical protein
MEKMSGRNITNLYTFDELSNKIQNNDFSDLEIGDYIETDILSCYGEDKIRWLFAGFDSYYNRSYNRIKEHHIVLVAEDCFKQKFCMNKTNNNFNGYYNSYMNQVVLYNYYKALLDVFGDSHILIYKERHYYSYFLNEKKADWLDTHLCLLNEMQVYGSIICGDGHNTVGIRNYQLPLFRKYPYKMQASGTINSNYDNIERDGYRGYWLSSISDYTRFCIAGCAGYVSNEYSSKEYGVRPFFLFY